MLRPFDVLLQSSFNYCLPSCSSVFRVTLSEGENRKHVCVCNRNQSPTDVCGLKKKSKRKNNFCSSVYVFNIQFQKILLESIPWASPPPPKKKLWTLPSCLNSVLSVVLFGWFLFDSFLVGYERLMPQKHLQQFFNDSYKSAANSCERLLCPHKANC